MNPEPLNYASPSNPDCPSDRPGRVALAVSLLSCPFLTMFLIARLGSTIPYPARLLSIPFLILLGLALGVYAAIKRRRAALPVTRTAVAAITLSLVWLVILAGIIVLVSQIDFPAPD